MSASTCSNWRAAFRGVLGAHDLRTRVSGNQWFVQLHLELPGDLTLSVAHGISDQAARCNSRRPTREPRCWCTPTPMKIAASSKL